MNNEMEKSVIISGELWKCLSKERIDLNLSRMENVIQLHIERAKQIPKLLKEIESLKSENDGLKIKLNNLNN